jgi:hypothetical protein
MTVRSDRPSSALRKSPRRHPTGGRVYDGPKRPRHALSAPWLVALLALAAAFVGLRGIHALADSPDTSAISTERVVVVGVTGRTEPTAADRTILGTHLGDAQVGAVSIRTRYLGDCAAAGWTTLGAGRRAAVGGLSPLGIGSLIIGIALWIAIFRYALRAVGPEFQTLRGTLVAALVTAIIGSLLNDGGISVWLTATAAITVTTTWFFVDRAIREDWTIRQPTASVG